MKYRFAFMTLMLALTLSVNSFALAQDDVARRIAPAVVTILTRDGAGSFQRVGSGVFVRSDGVLLTAYNLVQGAREIQVRTADGETYDHVELVSSDERRNIAVLSISAANTPFVGISMADETAVGIGVRAVYNSSGGAVVEEGGVLSSISLADEIAGAGTGFRVLKFTTPVARDAAGGILVDNYGRVLGLIAPLAQAQTRNYAVPLHTVSGLARSIPLTRQQSAALILVPGPRTLNQAIPVRQSSTTPLAPMPQVSVPQRPTTGLQPAGPGSAVVRDTDPARLLVGSRTLYITSASNVFKSVQLVNELRKRRELADWNLSLVDEREVADLVMEIEHIPLTWEFPFSIKHQRTGVVITAGKIYAWGGGDGAELMAARVIERFTRLRAAVKFDNKIENNATPKQ
jgi:S1-C subfamily serine protease